MKKFGNLVATIGEYTNKEGDKKKNYLTVGIVFEDDKGRLSVKMNAMPVTPEWSGWLSIYKDDYVKKDEDSEQAEDEKPIDLSQVPF